MNENKLLKNNTKATRAFDIVYALGLMLFFAVLCFLFYRQTIRYNGHYASDTSLYVNFAQQEDAYRWISYAFRFLHDTSGNTIGIAVYMALIIMIMVAMNYAILKYLLTLSKCDVPRCVIEIVSVAMLFTGSIYLPQFNPLFYKSCWSTFAWHSPTQQSMMAFGLVALLVFMHMLENYHQGIKPWEWIVLMVAGLMSTWSKPSFILVMAPSIIVVFILELLKKDELSIGSKFAKLFVMGCAFVPSGILMLYLNSLYFDSGSSENTISFGLNHFLSNGGHFFVPLVCGMLFPILVFAFNLKKFKDLKFKVAFAMLVVGTLEWMLIKEEGARASHGNFSWGKKLGCYYFYLCAFAVAIENFRDKEFMDGNRTKRSIYFALLGLSLVAMFLTQLYYFYAILRGHTYNF